MFLRQAPRDYAPRDKLGTGGTGRTGSPCDVPFRYGNQSRGTAGRLPGGTPIFFALAALRSVPQAGSQFRGLATAIEAPCSKLQGIFEM
ncbi:MAG: hypothetical protein WBG24_06110 [Syntrophobacteria bacterium]